MIFEAHVFFCYITHPHPSTPCKHSEQNTRSCHAKKTVGECHIHTHTHTHTHMHTHLRAPTPAELLKHHTRFYSEQDNIGQTTLLTASLKTSSYREPSHAHKKHVYYKLRWRRKPFLEITATSCK